MSQESYPKPFRLVHDFEAHDEVEMSAKKGEVIIAVGPPQDDWLFAYKYQSPTTRGYVPIGFVQELPNIEASLNKATAKPSVPSLALQAATPTSPLSPEVKESMDPPLALPSPIQNTQTPREMAEPPAKGLLASFDESMEEEEKQDPRVEELLNSLQYRGELRNKVHEYGQMVEDTLSEGFESHDDDKHESESFKSEPRQGSLAEMIERQEQYFQHVQLVGIMRNREQSFRHLEHAIVSAAQEIKYCQEKVKGLMQQTNGLKGKMQAQKETWSTKANDTRHSLTSFTFSSPSV